MAVRWAVRKGWMVVHLSDATAHGVEVEQALLVGPVVSAALGAIVHDGQRWRSGQLRTLQVGRSRAARSDLDQRLAALVLCWRRCADGGPERDRRSRVLGERVDLTDVVGGATCVVVVVRAACVVGVRVGGLLVALAIVVGVRI